MLQDKTKNALFSATDAFLVFLISIISMGTRLWMMESPDSVVFDEVHFGNFTNWYVTQEFFFDIHPPLSKLVMAGIAKLAQYNGEINFEERYAKQYLSENFITLRLTPEVFSALCAPLIYITMRFLYFSIPSSLLSAVFVIFETSLIVEGRFILSDGLLHFFTCLHLAVLSYTLRVPPNNIKSSLWLLLDGISLGCACSCKNTAWGLTVFNGIMHVINVFRFYKLKDLSAYLEILFRGTILSSTAVVVYLIFFAIHFIVIPYDGQGTAYLESKLQSILIKRDLIDIEYAAKRITDYPMLYKIASLSLTMHTSNMGIDSYHPYMSRPVNWPLLTGCWVGFYSDGDVVINCHGNVFIYYLTIVGVFLVFIFIRKPNYWNSISMSIGWAINYLPFYLIPRSMYLYHYHIPLMFAIMAFGSLIDFIDNIRFKWLVVSIFSIVAIYGYYYWSPFVYGYPIKNEFSIVWNDNWIYGDSYHRNQTAIHHNEN